MCVASRVRATRRPRRATARVGLLSSRDRTRHHGAFAAKRAGADDDDDDDGAGDARERSAMDDTDGGGCSRRASRVDGARTAMEVMESKDE